MHGNFGPPIHPSPSFPPPSYMEDIEHAPYIPRLTDILSGSHIPHKVLAQCFLTPPDLWARLLHILILVCDWHILLPVCIANFPPIHALLVLSEIPPSFHSVFYDLVRADPSSWRELIHEAVSSTLPATLLPHPLSSYANDCLPSSQSYIISRPTFLCSIVLISFLLRQPYWTRFFHLFRNHLISDLSQFTPLHIHYVWATGILSLDDIMLLHACGLLGPGGRTNHSHFDFPASSLPASALSAYLPPKRSSVCSPRAYST